MMNRYVIILHSHNSTKTKYVKRKWRYKSGSANGISQQDRQNPAHIALSNIPTLSLYLDEVIDILYFAF